MIFLTGSEKSIRLTVHAQPKASRTALVGIHGDALKIAVQAPPVEGEANQAIIEFLAEFFQVAKRDVIQKSGEQGRRKIFEIAIGISKAREKLQSILPAD